ncbi:cycloartenol-C-24-methyltransferase isoform X1 [Vitis vinifera]|uniref:cycloartenol-C-24-methyltransferase isoform X1 n=2 Tax=Vitis vinifera TaxID=29760 RepID=UPI0028834F03|nr:cycloartenol-C-24-methyltransferase isoform X1 [Vitis vinifera]
MPTWQTHEPCHPFVVSLKPTHLCAVLPPFLSRFTPSLSNSLSLSLGFPSRSSLSTYYTNPHFRFRFAEMSKAGALDLASGVGGKIQKDEVLSAVEKYEKYHVCYGGEEEERKANYSDMVNKYYDLVTSFYEFGWGESFHFAPRWKGESLRESIRRHEHFLALQLGVKPGQKVLDVGCGIGGPLREIARFSSTSVTGLNNNEYQITRGRELNCIAGVDKTCDFVKADFMKMPFSDNTFDAVYAIEATCHAPDALGCYKEIYRVLKPGQCFAAYEWCMTDAFDPNNQEHQKIKAEIEIGDGLPDIRLTRQCLEALKQAGFEVIWEKDLAVGSPLPWYLPLDKSHFSLSSFRLTAVGRFITKNMVKALEFVGLAPKGSQRVQAFLEKAAEGLVDGGKYDFSSLNRIFFHIILPILCKNGNISNLFVRVSCF